MKNTLILKDMKNVAILAQHLSLCPKVTRYNKGEEKQAWTIAHAFRDIEESFHKIFDVEIPILMDNSKDPNELYQTLLDIGEELRHIIYHIKDVELFKYLENE